MTGQHRHDERAHGSEEEQQPSGRGVRLSRLAYAEIHADEKGATAAGFLTRAAAFYAAHGIRVERVISDNAFAYRHSRLPHDRG